jgi:hypothetical protein
MQVNLSLDLAGFELDILSLEVEGGWGWRFDAINRVIVPEGGMWAKFLLEIQRERGVWLGLVDEGLIGPKTLS